MIDIYLLLQIVIIVVTVFVEAILIYSLLKLKNGLEKLQSTLQMFDELKQTLLIIKRRMNDFFGQIQKLDKQSLKLKGESKMLGKFDFSIKLK